MAQGFDISMSANLILNTASLWGTIWYVCALGSLAMTVSIPKVKSSTRCAWTFPTQDTVNTLVVSPSGDVVYAGSSDANIYSLDSSTGDQQWNLSWAPVRSLAIDAEGTYLYAGLECGLLGFNVSHRSWNFTSGDMGYSSVAASPSGQYVYAGSADNNVYALRASDGHQVWNFTADYAVQSVAASPSGEFVYAGSLDKHVYALRVSDGQKLWNVTAGAGVYSVATSPSGEFVYAGAWDKHVYALRASDGHMLWNFTAGHWVLSVAASPRGEFVYAGSWDGNVYALQASDGHQVWNFTADYAVSSVAASPSGEFVYAGELGNHVYALRASDGHQVWNFTAGDWVWSVAASPRGEMVYMASGLDVLARSSYFPAQYTVGEGLGVNALARSEHLDRLYGGYYDGGVFAVDDVDILWNTSTGRHLDSFTVHAEGEALYAGLDSGFCELRLHPMDGQKLWNVTAGAEVRSVAASPSGEFVFAGSWDNNVYALRASDGQKLWNVTAGAGVWSVAASPSGEFVYARSSDRNIYALRASDGQKLWNVTSGGLVSSVAASPSSDFVYAVSDKIHVYALRASDGQKLLDFTVGAPVSSVSASPSGDFVYVGSSDGRLYALSECTVLLRKRVTAAALSPSGDVVYAGSVDHHIYAISTSNGRQLWRFNKSHGGVISLALDSHASTIYAGSYDHYIYALNITDGALRWKHKVDSVARCLAVSPHGDLLYAGLDNFSVSALHIHMSTTEAVDWDAIYAWVGTGAGALVAVLWWASRCIPGLSGPIHFGVAGSLYGWALGAVTGYAMILLPKEVQSSMTTFSEDHGGMRWLVHAPGCYGFSVVACIFVMGIAWALAARSRKPLQLIHLCSALLLISTLCIAYNLVPGLWLVYSRASSYIYLGSRRRVLLAWCVFSYFVGLVYLVIGLALLDALYEGAERGRRTWRGHSYTRWLVLLPAFHWGFFVFWCSTAAAMFLCNMHGVFVPPCSPLIILGVGAGLISFGTQLVSRPTDEHGWARDRALKLALYLTWWPWARDASLRKEWRKHTDDLQQAISLRKVVQLCLNAWCPEWCGLRRRVSARTGLRLTSIQGCQPVLKDELTWSFLKFTATSLVAVMPLFVLWLYTRFNMWEPQTLSLKQHYTVSTTGAQGRYDPTPTIPIPIFGDASLSYFPLVFDSFSPFLPCNGTKIERAVDPGDFNLCMNEHASTCLLYGCVWAKCLGLSDTILAEPSSTTWSNVQLAVYAGFLLVCIWTITQEADEKLHILVAFNLNRTYEHGGTWRHWHWWTRFVIVPAFLLMLAGIDVACLRNQEASQDYYIFSNPRDLQQWSRRNVSRLGPERGMYSSSSALGKGALAWYCDAGDFEEGPPRVLQVTYSMGEGIMVALAVAQGMYFFYQCYSLVSKQRKLYDFVDNDLLISRRSMQHWEDCSYRSIYRFSIRESADAMSREDVAEHLHRTVYVPFLCEAYKRRPDLVQSLFNESDVCHLSRYQECSVDEDGDERKSPFSSDE